MSLLELIAKRSNTDSAAFSLPGLLAEQALAELKTSGPVEALSENQKLSLIVAEHFATELLKPDMDGARQYTELLLDYGISERRFLGSVVPDVAAALGRGWEDDRLDFSQVTQAMGYLMTICRETMSPPPSEVLQIPDRPRILLMRTPGEDHTLGLLLTAQEMRRNGWLVRMDMSGEMAALKVACANQDFDIIGFSASSLNTLPPLREIVGKARQFQPDARIITGGLLGVDDPEFAGRIGADLSLGRSRLAVEALARALGMPNV